MSKTFICLIIFLSIPGLLLAWNLVTISGVVGGLLSWADWDEQSESTLNPDQDNNGTEDTYICFFEGGASQNETGQGGGLSGADLVLTQIGSVAGATGSPPSRYISRTGGDYFNLTTAAADAMISGTDYTLILKCHTLSTNYASSEFYGTRGHMRHGYSNFAGLYANGGGAGEFYQDCAVQPPSTGDFYLFLTSKAGKALYAGWSLTKPTVLADIPANQKVSTTLRNWNTGTWSTRHSLVALTTAGGTTVYAYYAVLSKSELIIIP